MYILTPYSTTEQTIDKVNENTQSAAVHPGAKEKKKPRYLGEKEMHAIGHELDDVKEEESFLQGSAVAHSSDAVKFYKNSGKGGERFVFICHPNAPHVGEFFWRWTRHVTAH